MKTENDKAFKSLRKELRNNMPLPEILLWIKLKGSQTGYKFRRQQGIGKYILDFYCPSKKLSIEIDGDSHFDNNSMKYDLERTSYLMSLGITELRFMNSDILKNINGVVEKIMHILSTTPTPSFIRRGAKRYNNETI